MLAVGPDGRRVGDDATTGRPSTRLMGPSFGPVRSWTDPWQQRAASQPSKRLAVLDPAAGTWRLVVTSRAAGPLDFAIGWSLPGVQRSLAQVAESAVQAGRQWKYRVSMVESGGRRSVRSRTSHRKPTSARHRRYGASRSPWMLRRLSMSMAPSWAANGDSPMAALLPAYAWTNVPAGRNQPGQTDRRRGHRAARGCHAVGDRSAHREHPRP